MTIKKLMMAAGAVDGPQVIAPSSNDWDMSLGIFTFAGNTLGDHTVGGTVHAFQAKENFSSLITLDGDFIISFTLEDRDLMTFGVHGLESDGDRTNTDHNGQYYFSTDNTGFWWGIDYGSSGTKAMIKGTAEGSFTAPANGSTIIIRRESGTITLEDDGSVLHTYSETYSAPMRFGGGSDTHGLDASLKDLFITDTDKVQRDGQFDEAPTNGSVGDGIGSRKHSGLLFKATRTGTITSNMVEVISVNTGANFHCEVWSHDGTNPGSQLGSDSTTVSLGTTGKKTFVFTDPAIVKGTYYWMILVDESTSGHVALTQHLAHPSGMGAGMHDTLTSISDDWAEGTAMEITYTATGEPTPDHDTLLLIHSDTSDGSTTFVDSSQFGRTDTVAGNTQHDTAQKKFGASAILFDGTGDYLTYPDSSDWKPAAITIDLWIRLDTGGISQPIMGQWGGGASSAHAWYLHIGGSNTIEWTVSNGSSSVTSSSTTGMSTGTWYHIAAVYNSNGGGSGIWVNGTSEATNSSLVTIQDYSEVVRIGTDFAGRYFDGWMDEIRISKTARWEPGVNFTPPTSAYS